MPKTLSHIIFFSRWVQLPMYLGLIVAQCVYVYKFLKELSHLVTGTWLGTMDETDIMLMVLGLVDIVMIANLLIMIIIGGYDIFVSRVDFDGHRDQPEWLSHVNAGVLKVKLSMAIISISSIHLLSSFMDMGKVTDRELIAQGSIHMIFVVSALMMAWIEKINDRPQHH
ncbi:MAG: TIGR00645 family protein [Formosimonas sp.]